MSLAIRTALPSDAACIAPLFDLYRQFFTGRADIETSRRFLAERLERNESVVVAAFEDEAAVGFLQLYPLFSSWYAKRQWFLSDLYVVGSHRKRGIGRRLVCSGIDVARSDGSRSILVEIPLSQPHLIAFYISLGFAKDEVFELYRVKLE